MMCQRIGRSPISPMGLGRAAVSSDRRVPRPPARMTTFTTRRVPRGDQGWTFARSVAVTIDVANSAASGNPQYPDVPARRDWNRFGHQGIRVSGVRIDVADPMILQERGYGDR